MKGTISLLLSVDANSRVMAPSGSRHRYPSLPEHIRADLVPQPASERDLAPKFSKVGVSESINSIRHSATWRNPPSPCTVDSETRNASASTYSAFPPSDISNGGFSPDLWTVSPEERSLMTNSANFARGRRRRGAIQHDIPLELELSPSSSAIPTSPSALPHDSDSSDDGNARHSEDLSVNDDKRATPRGRLQRSFTPSERDDAGVVLVPGLLRRLGRPFSGPWRGPSSPLAPVSMVAAPPVGGLSRLRRLFSRCH